MNSNPPLVSILMPVFNGAALLERSLTSLLRQTYQNIEIVILDNLSTDATREICERFAVEDKRVQYHLDTRQRITHDAANQLAEFARGAYCFAASDDDLWEPSFIEALITPMQEDPSIDLVFCDCMWIDTDDVVFGRRFLNRHERTTLGNGPFRFWWTYLMRRNVVPVIFGLYKTSAWRASIPFKTFDISIADVDNLFVLKFAAQNKIAIVPRVLFKYRYRDRDIKSLANVPDFRGKASNLNLYLYALRHQVRFTNEIFAVLSASKFSFREKVLLRLRVIYSFGIQLLVKYWVSRLHTALINRSRSNALSMKLSSMRSAHIIQQWKTSTDDQFSKNN